MTFWMSPQQAAQPLQLIAAGPEGLVALRAELGGLFLGLAALCLTGVLTKSRSYLIAAALVLMAIITGRLIGLMATGRGGVTGLQSVSLAVELISAVVLMFCARAD
ncbi:MAG: hypothetical protein U0V70_19300 [Terriglobia bacterium]